MNKSFNWLYLIIAIVAITAFAANNERWGKIILALVIVSALLIGSNRVMNAVDEGLKK